MAGSIYVHVFSKAAVSNSLYYSISATEASIAKWLQWIQRTR